MASASLDTERVRGWFETYLEHKCTCQYCGFDGSRSLQDWFQLQGDHLIPRNVAAEYAEDNLNRVISCFYCNLVKRNFDPALGEFKQVLNREVQRQLIERARIEIERRKQESWSYGGGPEASYRFMMKRLHK